MMYGNMPLYPSLSPGCCDDACVRVPLFNEGRPPAQGLPPVGELQRVALENPCRPGEWAEVLLGVDACGNLALCVRRDECGCRPACPPRPFREPDRPKCPPPACRPRPRPCPPPRPGCRRGRLYGAWDNG